MSVDAVLIAGPTASGKSAAALALAEEMGGVIVNADSMQVYAELRALSARPSQADEARVPHRLYGHVRVRERYSAGRYQNESARALEEALKKKLLPIFVGGTGLYFAALTDGLSPIPSVPPEVRASVRQRFETLGREAFFADFAARDPATAANLKVSDTQRLMRAADVLEATGRPLSAWQELSGKSVLAGLRAARFVVSPPRDGAQWRAGGSECASRTRCLASGRQGPRTTSTVAPSRRQRIARGGDRGGPDRHKAVRQAAADLVSKSDARLEMAGK